jgi:hypothetical protein
MGKVTAQEVIEYIDNLILSDSVTGTQCETLKKTRRIIQSVDTYKLVEKEEIKSKRGGAPKNPYKRKSSGKMGKRCIHCSHFEKYSRDKINEYKCVGRCKFFDIEVRDTFNGCSQEEGKVYLHNFDEDEVVNLKMRVDM